MRPFKLLKNSIIKGEIKPNQRIQERKVASLFNISPTPVREAIKRLAGEGLIRIDLRIHESCNHEILYETLLLSF